MTGIRLAEQMNAGHAVDVEHQRQQQAHIPHRAQALEQRADQELEPGQRRDQPQQSQRPRQPQHGRKLGIHGQATQRDDGEVEHVPAIAEIVPGLASMHGHLERNLDEKDGEHQEVQCLQPYAVPGDEGRTRLQPGQNPRQNNHHHDCGFEPSGVDQGIQFRIHEKVRLIRD